MGDLSQEFIKEFELLQLYSSLIHINEQLIVDFNEIKSIVDSSVEKITT